MELSPDTTLHVMYRSLLPTSCLTTLIEPTLGMPKVEVYLLLYLLEESFCCIIVYDILIKPWFTLL